MSTVSSPIPYFLPEWQTNETCLRGTSTDEFFCSAFLPCQSPTLQTAPSIFIPILHRVPSVPEHHKTEPTGFLPLQSELAPLFLTGVLSCFPPPKPFHSDVSSPQSHHCHSFCRWPCLCGYWFARFFSFWTAKLLQAIIHFFSHSRENINHPPFQGQLLYLSLIVSTLLFISSDSFLHFSALLCTNVKILFHRFYHAHFFITVIFEIRTHFLTVKILKLNGSALLFPLSLAWTIRCALQSRLCQTGQNTVTKT